MNTEFPVLLTEKDVLLKIAKDMQTRRIQMGFTQVDLADRSGVPEGTLKRFEQSGHISIKNLVKLAFALKKIDELATAFETKEIPDLFTLRTTPVRKRVRHKGH
ncbi:helix-turn-helix domain-containing protein [Leptospirillum ferrooxidans]|jgi:transcriptional regulator with XRE-family HTH domain|uniref:HTH cro/C1-type domain-containing protein n=1 Tax=Leptospirillum ferrooxidans (strain C2-3) TaxID=1162668 RepID=I0INZ3_LEPFC|nr:helix-turn-helix transcriptional regulator [Leptospirillum ferrooxidans]BAM06992.1 hypothetical protein LFE_1309 [Leptospirillum ferrooxidans C2-3]